MNHRPPHVEKEAVLLSHSLDHGVLVVTVHHDPGVGGQAGLIARISGLVEAYRPAPLVVLLEQPATAAAVGALLRVHRLCSRLGVLMSVATHSAPTRRALEAQADPGGTRLVVHARADVAVAAAFAAAA
ncbi:hypothetical protein ACFC5X_18300 [Streptomyces sp. NPDC055952]|uniref:hypothetical protein n=1 Tax=Streptomyces sp. NPDC055952 TaxID=3345663 RepID=UPI0035DC19F9